MYRIVYTKQAVKDIKKLKGSGLAARARRINIKHRLVYQVHAEKVNLDGLEYEGIIKIVRMWTYYEKL